MKPRRSGTRLPGNWASIRRIVRARSGGQCEAHDNGIRCTRTAREVHHAAGPDVHDPDALVDLCPDHHAIQTQAEARQALRAIHARARHPPEPHPGLLS